MSFFLRGRRLAVSIVAMFAVAGGIAYASIPNAGRTEAQLAQIDGTPPELTVSGTLDASPDQTLSGDELLDLHVQASDSGLGVSRIWLTQDGTQIASTQGTCGPNAGVCLADLTLDTNVSARSLHEGETTFTLFAEDPAGNPQSDVWLVYVDRSPPAIPDGLNVLSYDASLQQAIIGWNEPADPLAPDGTLGAGVTQYTYRYRLDGGAWSAWTTTPEPQTTDLDANPASQIDVQVTATDGAGNTSPAADWSSTLPTDTEIAGGSEEIPTDAGTDPPLSGPPEFPTPTSTPAVAVPSGVTPADHYDRVEYGPELTDTDITLEAVASTGPGTFALSGVVVDSVTGAPISGATVRLGGVAAATTTGSEGGWAFAELPPSQTTSVTVTASGYATSRETDLVNPTDDAYELTFRLDRVASP